MKNSPKYQIGETVVTNSTFRNRTGNYYNECKCLSGKIISIQYNDTKSEHWYEVVGGRQNAYWESHLDKATKLHKAMYEI